MKRLDSRTIEHWRTSRPEEWQSASKRGDESVAVSWIPVVDVSSCGIILGVCADGYWVRGDGATIEVVDGCDAPIAMLPCLEIDSESLLALLRGGLATLDAVTILSDTFPLIEIALCGLESRSERWISLAMNRLDEGLRDTRFESALLALTQNAPTQRLRHRARALLRRIKKE